MKVDLCMWAKNGALFLPHVLKRIDEVIPGECVNQKIFVDDSSVDDSVRIAKCFNWDVYPNHEGWISGGTKEALSHVETEFFVSIEQDVLLAKNWWPTILKYMEDKKVAVAQGIRFSTNAAYRAFEKYNLKKVNELSFEERSRLYFSIDNNVYRTKIIKQLGFSDDPVSMIPFYEKIVSNGYKWITDTNLVSDHFRTSFFNDINHTIRLYTMTKMDTFLDHISLLRLLLGLPFSLKFIRSRNAFVFLTSTLLRFSYIPIYFHRRKNYSE